MTPKGAVAITKIAAADGSFAFEDLGAGKVHVVVTALGFDPLTVDEDIEEDKVTEATYRLTPTAAPGQGLEVNVYGDKPPREVTKRTLDRAELERIPGTNGDTLRAPENLLGVARPPWARRLHLLIVRGSAPQDTQVFIDGTPVPLIYHFGGLSSVVPTEMLEKIDFYPGNYSALYGRALGGIVDVGLRSPKDDGHYHGLLQADLIDTRAMLEGPIPLLKGWNFVAGGRRSFLDAWFGPVASAAGIGAAQAPVYYDYQFLAETKLSPTSKFRIAFFGADDAIQLFLPKPSVDEPALSGNAGLHTAFSRIQLRFTNESGNGDRVTVLSAFGHDRFDFALGPISADLQQDTVTGRFEVSKKVNRGIVLNMGVDMLAGQFALDLRLPQITKPGEPPSGPISVRQIQESKVSGPLVSPGVYVEAELQPTDRARIVPGVRVDVSSLSNGAYDQPASQRSLYDLIHEYPKTVLKGGIGVYVQPPQPSEAQPPIGSPNLVMERSVQYEVGLEQDITHQIDISVDGFYKQLDQLVFGAPYAGEANSGTGYVVGSGGAPEVQTGQALLRLARLHLVEECPSRRAGFARAPVPIRSDAHPDRPRQLQLRKRVGVRRALSPDFREPGDAERVQSVRPRVRSLPGELDLLGRGGELRGDPLRFDVHRALADLPRARPPRRQDLALQVLAVLGLPRHSKCLQPAERRGHLVQLQLHPANVRDGSAHHPELRGARGVLKMRRARRFLLGAAVTFGIAVPWLTSCSSDFDAPSRIEGIRVLAVVADEPFAHPGDTVQLKMTYDAAGAFAGVTPSILWISDCFDPDGDSYFGCYAQFASLLEDLQSHNLPPPGAVSNPLARGVVDWQVTLPDDIISKHPPPATGSNFGVAYVFFVVCAGEIRAATTTKRRGPELAGNFPLGCFDKDGHQIGADGFVPGFTEVYAFADGRENANPAAKSLLIKRPLEPDAAYRPLGSKPEDAYEVVACSIDEDARRKLGVRQPSFHDVLGVRHRRRRGRLGERARPGEPRERLVPARGGLGRLVHRRRRLRQRRVARLRPEGRARDGSIGAMDRPDDQGHLFDLGRAPRRARRRDRPAGLRGLELTTKTRPVAFSSNLGIGHVDGADMISTPDLGLDPNRVKRTLVVHVEGDPRAALLAERFGIASFHPWQREAIDALLDTPRARVLLVAPTGGGKSLCYQFPAVALGGTTLVLCPLISLMVDQVRALVERGVRATYIASSLPREENGKRLAALRKGEIEIVYAAPERLVSDGFGRRAARPRASSLVAVDEAHCIVQWGHDFRPDYLRIGALLERLRPPRVVACTATATPDARSEIARQLRFAPEETTVVLRGFARPNLHLSVEEVSGPREAATRTAAALRAALGSPRAPEGAGIVYAATRKRSEEIAAGLVSVGFRAKAYHAGLPSEERAAVSEAFAAKELHVVVATNAFGMGIDRPDVRVVVHAQPPSSIEAVLLTRRSGARWSRRRAGERPLAPRRRRHRGAATPLLRRELGERDARGRRGARLGPVPRAPSLRGRLDVPTRFHPSLLRRRGRVARRLRALRCVSLGLCDGGG